jgi:hypothetical protein
MQTDPLFDVTGCDEDRIRAVMESRRAQCREQERAAELQSAICDEFRNYRDQQSGLTARISALEETDEVMFQYIRRLERVNAGVWCAGCRRVKVVGEEPPPAASNDEWVPNAAPSSPPTNYTSISPPPSITDPFTPILSRVQRALAALSTELSTIDSELTRLINAQNKVSTIITADQLFA